MSTLQTILSLGALLLLSLIITRMNSTSGATEDVLYNTGYGLLATSLSTSIIEDAARKSFDCASDTAIVSDVSSFTDYDKLGCETGEDPNDINTFNDVDDFNGYAAADSSMPSAVFNIRCNVCYVNESNPDLKVNSKTWHKKITVYVTSKYMHGALTPEDTDTIKVSSIFSYRTSK